MVRPGPPSRQNHHSENHTTLSSQYASSHPTKGSFYVLPQTNGLDAIALQALLSFAKNLQRLTGQRPPIDRCLVLSRSALSFIVLGETSAPVFLHIRNPCPRKESPERHEHSEGYQQICKALCRGFRLGDVGGCHYQLYDDRS
jgi:hypothetical protein